MNTTKIKTKLPLVLLLALAVMLCGCQSYNYAKGQKILDDTTWPAGTVDAQYKAAREIFVKLGDYKDSAKYTAY